MKNHIQYFSVGIQRDW